MSEEWITHDGGPMPVREEACVEYRLSTGKAPRQSMARFVDWKRVVEYRVLSAPQSNPAPAPESTSSQIDPNAGDVSGDGKLNPNETDPYVLWAEIARLTAAVKGPDGYASWQAVATDERIRRVKAEAELAALQSPVEGEPEMPHLHGELNTSSGHHFVYVKRTGLTDYRTAWRAHHAAVVAAKDREIQTLRNVGVAQAEEIERLTVERDECGRLSGTRCGANTLTFVTPE